MSKPAVELAFELCGVVYIAERFPAEAGSPGSFRTFRTADLLKDLPATDIEMEIGYSENPNRTEELGFYIELRASHQKDPDSDRAFHSHLTVHPNREDIEKLRDFCEFLLKLTPDATAA